MIINNQINVNKYIDRVPTEKTIFKLLVRDKNKISDKYELMPYPLAQWINSKGVGYTNAQIAKLRSVKTRVFVCQHILVNKLKFDTNDVIFTPHSTRNDRYHTIPHYAVNIDNKYIKQDREYSFSFLGSTTTHLVRKRLVKLFPKNCFDTNVHWGFEHQHKRHFVDRYVQLLGNSYFTACPRGTGISSVRLFESMAMNSIPIILADKYDPPLSSIIDWSRIAVKVKMEDISKIPSVIKHHDWHEIVDTLSKVYNTHFSNSNLHKTIEHTLNT